MTVALFFAKVSLLLKRYAESLNLISLVKAWIVCMILFWQLKLLLTLLKI